ncbi:MAG: glycosyltransferase family 4 protein [Candidatus Paceibacterota bacterium]
MKIGLIFFHSFSSPGGVKRHVLGLQKEFIKRGISVKIIAPRRRKAEDYGEDVILLGTSFPVNFSGSQADFCVNINPLAVRRVLQKEKFDILHFHNFGFPSISQILNKSESLNIMTCHADLSGSRFLKIMPYLVRLLNRAVQRKINGIIGVAYSNIKFLDKYSGPKIVIPNGVDLDEFNPGVPKIKKFLDGKINILFVGRIEKRKGLIYLLKAYRILTQKFSNLRLIIVGEGELRESCEGWVKRHHLKEVYFEGQAADEKIPSYFATADIFVSPAIFGESFGLVLLEAMACGVPMVVFANQGYGELLKGKRGEEFLVPPKDYKALAEKIALLVKNDSLRKEISRKVIIEAQEYSWSNVADRVLDFYQFCKKQKS